MTKILENREDTSRNSPWWKKVIAWGGKNWFYITLFLLAAIGVPCAFFIPPRIPGLKDDGNTVVSLRQGILAVLAGALTMLTLWETHRKNTHEKDKNERDHIRQVYAERRSRYTKAVEQLANEKAAVRLGGIYTLVGLVDEWLADDTLESEEQQKEGQVIINNLCSYIRSPFPPAERLEEYKARKEFEDLKIKNQISFSMKEAQRYQVLLKRFEKSAEYQEPKDLASDQTAFREEQDVRRTIFSEMSKRSSTFSEDKKSSAPGPWSNFKFDFGRAPIFYPLNNLTIEKANFSSGRFYDGTSFRNTLFAQNADFVRAIFSENASFRRATFAQNADFSGATFTQYADFWEVIFVQNANFNKATFIQNAEFLEAIFKGNVEFVGVTFTNSEPAFAELLWYARFSAATNPLNCRFSVTRESEPLELGTATLLGKPFTIPVGTVLFDPDSWDEKDRKYTESKPAEPLDESDEAQENKTE